MSIKNKCFRTASFKALLFPQQSLKPPSNLCQTLVEIKSLSLASMEEFNQKKKKK